MPAEAEELALANFGGEINGLIESGPLVWLSTYYIFVVACSQVHCRFPKAEEIAYSSLSPQSMAQSLAQYELWLLSKEDGRQDSQVENGPGSLSGKESGCGLVDVKEGGMRTERFARSALQ